MPCPHSTIGDAASCSQCHGAVPRIVARHPDNGALTIDGELVVRTFQPKTPQKYQTSAKRVAGMRRRSAAKRKDETDDD